MMVEKDHSAHKEKPPYASPVDEVLQRLGSSEEGLSASAVTQKAAVAGPNRLPEPPPESMLKRFLRQFHDLLIYVLLASAGITALLAHWLDTGVILGVVVINALIGFVQEGRAEQALAGIRRLLSATARVRRDGRWQEIEAQMLVPGDIVRLRSGDRVPADLRLISTINLLVEESALTGESEASHKHHESVAATAALGDRACMAYSGTMVVAGRGVGVVTAIGADTEIGRINVMLGEVEKIATPLTRQMNRFGSVLSFAIVGLALLLVAIGRGMHGYAWTELFFAAIGFAVAAIPEGLPAILTITLALGVQRMARRRAITRKLDAIETLGSVTVICSDKTGTLTKNEMTVRSLVTTAASYSVEGSGYVPQGAITRNDDPAALEQHPDLQAVIEVLSLCNDAEIHEQDGQWRVVGEPTEAAMQTLAGKAGFTGDGYHRVAVVPFESHNKYMATLHRFPDERLVILVKGAPDRILDRCGSQRSVQGETEPLDRSFWEERVDQLGRRGLRVLAAAARPVGQEKSTLSSDDFDHDLSFLGLVGIIDPPRPEAVRAISLCRQAGIKVKMITGDHAGTALAIGREMGIIDGDGEDRVVSGPELEDISDERLVEMAGTYDIFARTSPEHKLRLVKALQAVGEVVAMTGDGVNDAPALKRADVGVAMGIKGTEATKEAADIVLADDNFLSIEQAVEEGRTIYDNLRKAILFVLPTNGAEGLVMLVAVAFGLVLPLTPVQILWVNMVTAVTLGLALAFEPTEPGIMSRPPRRPDEPILGSRLIWRIAFVSLLIGSATIASFLFVRLDGLALEQARTMAVNTLVFGEIFYLLNTRFIDQSSLRLDLFSSNPAVWLTIVLLLVLQALFTYAPIMQLWFGSAGLTLHHWLIPLTVGFSVFFLVEAQKAVDRYLLSRSTASGG